MLQPMHTVIQEGDMVIVYERFDSMKAVTVSAKGQYQNRFGCFLMKVRSVSICHAYEIIAEVDDIRLKKNPPPPPL